MGPSESIYLNSFYSPFVYPSLAFNSGFIIGEGNTKLALEAGYQRFIDGNAKARYNGFTACVGVRYNFGQNLKK